MSEWIVYSKDGLTERCKVKKLTYDGEFLGACSLTVNVSSPVPVAFELGDYLVYRGERFEINYDPTVVKQSAVETDGEGFVYENVIFNSLSDELTRCDFLDYVPSDNELHYSSLPTFTFFADSINKLAKRIQVNLDRIYTGEKKWTVEVPHPEYVNTLNVNIQVSNNTVWDALGFVNSKFGASFIIRNRTITIGTTGVAVGNVFSYGKGNGLYKIERNAESNQKIITRLRAYGSTRNMPSDYYLNVEGGDVPNNMAVKNLMLPSFPVSTHDPYIDSDNIEELGIREGTVFFDGSGDLEEIYPTMEGMTAEDLEKAGISVNATGALDEVLSAEQIEDNGVFEPAEGETSVTTPTFTITLKDVGFDINDYLTTSSATISMKDGMCGGREFEIVSCEKSGDNYVLTCNRHYDESLDLYFPYNSYQIESGDKFVLLNIEMPDVYIKAASERLLVAAKAYLAKNDYVRYSYTLTVDNVFMARQHDEAIASGGTSIHDTIKEGDIMLFEDTDLGINGGVTIASLSINESSDDSMIPQYEVTLKDEKTVGSLEKIQNQITSILAGGVGSGTELNTAQIQSLIEIYGSKIFLRKDKDDETKGSLGIQKDLNVGGNAKVVGNAEVKGNADIEGDVATRGDVVIGSEGYAEGFTGFGTKFSRDGSGEMSRLTLRHELRVPKLVFNSIEINVGDKWRGAGGGVIERVEPDYNEDGSLADTGTIWLQLEEGQIGAVYSNAISQGIFHDFNNKSNNETSDAEIYEDDKMVARTFAGFTTVYFLITEISDYTDENGIVWHNKQCRYQLRPTSSNWTSKAHPYAQMNFVCYGVMSDDEELLEKYGTSAYETRTYTRLLWRQNTWGISARNIASQSGDLSNLDILGLDAKGYSNYLNSVYFTGEIRQVNPNTGEAVKTANDRGAWESGTTYYYYDRVSHDGGLWLCVAEDGTNTEPKEGDSAWLLQVKSGTSVTAAGYWESSKVPYAVNTIVTFADKVWISNKETSEPPFGIYTDKDANKLIYKDSGYILVETLIQSEDWDLLLDAPQLTDGKDGESMQVRYSSDKTNWHSTFTEGDIWMQQRVGEDALWSDAIRIVGEAGAAGVDGTYHDYQFAVNDSLTIAPASGWQDTPPSVGIGQYLWMRTRFVDPNSSEVNPWSVVRIGGEKGRGVETVIEYYQVSESNTVAPTTWVKEMPTLTPTLKYLWNYEDVVYTDTEKVSTTPIVIGMYSKDGNGINSVTEYYGLTDDSDTQPTSWDTEILKPTQELRFLWNKVVTLYTEGEETTVIRIIAVHGEKGDGFTTMGAWKTGMAVPYLGIVTMGGKTFVAKSATTNPPIWVYTDNAGNRLIYKDEGYVLEGTQNTEEYDLLIQNGKDGSDGKSHEYVYIHTTEDKRPPTPTSVQTDDYIPSGWHDDPVGVSETLPYEWVCVRIKKEGIWGNYSTPALWAKFGKDGIDGIQGIQGEKGEQGIAGEKGADGLTSYFHIKFADDANGTNMNESGGDYIGTYVDFVQADSTDPKTYTWVKTRGAQGEKGDQGIAGTNGINGETSYLHIAYANSADGNTDFSVSDSTDKLYIGQYTDFVLEDSIDPSKYKWTLIKGADGVSIKSVTVTYGKSNSLSSMPSSWSSALPNVGEGEYLWTRTITDYTDESKDDTVTYTYTYQGKTGTAGTSVKVSSIQYQAGSSATTAPTGTWSDSVVSVPQGQYLWTKTTFSDGTTAYGVAKQGSDGKDGEGFTMNGNWVTGLSVPKMGVVTMGGNCFAAKVATTNPPMWCWTDNLGNRLIFSTTEYIITGELNTSEYELWSVKGEDGKDGINGVDGKDGDVGNSTFKSTVFYRSNTEPSIPTGGSYSSPIPTSSPTWSDGIPSGEQKLWASTRIFTRDGSSPQQDAWSTPRQMTDTASFDVEWSALETNVGNPTDNPDNWSDTASTNSIWMATRVKTNGVWGSWQITKIKGETGKTGYTGCVTRVFQEYSSTQVYRNDSNAAVEELDVSGIRYLDMLVLATEDLVNYPSGYVAFECLKTHSGHATTESGYWREFSSNIASQFVPKLVALDAHLRFASSGQVVILNEEQVPCAGMTGDQEGDKTRIWAGGEDPDTAPFAVNQNGETTASKFRTARAGLRMEASNGLISIFGSLAKNIEFGVNEEGLAVMRYYDNDGTLLYDLGPAGISTVKRDNDKWVLKRLTYLGSDSDALFSTYWDEAKNPYYSTGENKYQFLSGYIGSAFNDAANHRKLFNSQSKTDLNGNSNVISDGWYCDSLAENATELDRIQYITGVLPDDMNESNPSVSTSVPIYVTQVFYVLDGLVFNRMNVYYNLV